MLKNRYTTVSNFVVGSNENCRFRCGEGIFMEVSQSHYLQTFVIDDTDLGTEYRIVVEERSETARVRVNKDVFIMNLSELPAFLRKHKGMSEVIYQITTIVPFFKKILAY